MTRLIPVLVVAALTITGAAHAHHQPKPGNPCANHPAPHGYTIKTIRIDGSAVAERVEQRRHLRFLWRTVRDGSSCRWSEPRIVRA